MRYAIRTISLLTFLVSPLLLVNGQDRLRTINDVRNNFRNPPIVVIDREVHGKKFDGRQDIAGPDWLEGLAFTVKNISPKNIKRIYINIAIPKQGSMEHMAGFGYPFPQGEVIRTEKGGLAFGKPSMTILEPGATVKLRASPGMLRILDVIKEQGVTDITEVEMAIREVVFEDGTGWLTGVPTVEDPTRPGSMIIVKSSN